jgi:hypothetical protein
MFFGGYDEDDDDDIQQTSSQTDEVETFEDVVPELDLGEPPDDVKEFARQHIGESPGTRSSVLQEFRDMIYGELLNLMKTYRNCKACFLSIVHPGLKIHYCPYAATL